MELVELRQEMDKLHVELLSILERRAELSKRIAIYKYKHHLPVFDKEREEKMLAKVVQSVEDKEFSPEIISIMRQLFEISKEIQSSVIDKLKKSEGEF
ncbi:MAG: chorismate mutase [Streptococcaceae bacterium]|nr:chorismate mutase [Streptococcaceae bacterium]